MSNLVTDQQDPKEENDKDIKILIDKIFQFFISLFGIIFSFSISNYGKMNNVIVSSATALVASLILPKHDDLYLSGSLGGMSSNTVLINYGFVIFCGFLIFFIFNRFPNVLPGLGGRLGTIAFISNCLTSLLIYLISLSNVYEYNYPLLIMNKYRKIDVYVLVFFPIFSSISAILSYIVFEYILIRKNMVTASTLIALAISLLLTIFNTPLKYDDTSPSNYGELFSNSVHVGTLLAFTKMEKFSQFNYLGNYNFYHFLISGYISGWVGIALIGVFIFGGKNGFTAFIGCNIYIRILQFIFWIISLLNSKQENEIKGETVIKTSNKDDNYSSINKMYTIVQDMNLAKSDKKVEI